MKKIKILVFLIYISSNIRAQTTIYTQDFASGVPAGWAITDSTGLGKIWTYDTNGPSGLAANPADTLKSTTYSNGIMIMDDDYYGQAPGMNSTSLISTAINCSLYNKVRVKFQDFFRYFAPAASQGILYVSADSINWIDVYHAEAGLTNNQATPNPNFNDINISTIAANQPALYLKFLYRGDWGYYWELDDIEVYRPAPVAVEEINLLGNVNFFPNPTDGIIHITGLLENAVISITNQQGQIVLAKDLNILSNQLLDLSKQSAGIYHLYIKTKSGIINQTINIVK